MRLGLAVTWIALIACSGPERAARPSAERLASSAPAPADWQTCGTDEDCAIVEVGCSDYCSGGQIISVGTLHLERARERYPQTQCKQRRTRSIVDTTSPCTTPAAICMAGRCGYRMKQWSLETTGWEPRASRDVGERLPSACAFDPSAVAIDCRQACASYTTWARTNSCLEPVMRNVDPHLPVISTEGGAPLDAAECLATCTGAGPNSSPEDVVAWACFARRGTCDGWSACYHDCWRW